MVAIAHHKMKKFVLEDGVIGDRNFRPRSRSSCPVCLPTQDPVAPRLLATNQVICPVGHKYHRTRVY